MGKVAPGSERRTFVGRSDGTRDDPAKLSEALQSAADQIVEAQLVSGDQTMWFDVTSLEVEIANQHVKTFKAGVTGRG
jgi:hypothetical protein